MGTSRQPNIVSVSWGDHLVFGEGDGRLDTVGALNRRMEAWVRELGAGIIHWRCVRDRIQGRFYAARGYKHFFTSIKTRIEWDDLEVVPELAHDLGMKAYLYVTLFDEGWRLLPKKVRETSYHNAMHCQHVGWQSEFSRKHPDYAVADRSQKERQWGVLCLAYPEVRNHLIRRYQRLLESGGFDGLFVCFRSQSKPADFADQFGFNEPARQAYLERYGTDIWCEDFDLESWRDLLGEFITRFLMELKKKLTSANIPLAVGVPRGNILGPPMGNTTLQWETWIREGIIDQIVVDQNSSRCPSMWHDLWPMHRGYGYLQNYLNGWGLKSLEEDLSQTYGPLIDGCDVELYAARQWHERSEGTEQDLLRHPTVQGLVCSSFRHDNPEAVSRNDWSA